MLYIDPSESRTTSKLEKLLSNPAMMDIPSQLLPGLETRTGADMLNSPLDAPTPTTDILLKMHIEAGASLIQNKFAHDLIASIVDGRFKECQAKMIETGAMPWQIVLLFYGFTSLNKQGELLIDNKRPIDIIGFKGQHFDDMAILFYHIDLWEKRGGRFRQILARDLPDWLIADTKAMATCRDEPEKLIYPYQKPLYEEELALGDNPNLIEREWLAAQKLTMVSGLRAILNNAIPGLGSKKANAIFQYLGDSKHPQSWYGFHDILMSGEITKVDRIGKGIMNKIRETLKNEG